MVIEDVSQFLYFLVLVACNINPHCYLNLQNPLHNLPDSGTLTPLQANSNNNSVIEYYGFDINIRLALTL